MSAPAFQDPWPLPRLIQSPGEMHQELLRAWREYDRRHRQYVDSPKRERFFRRCRTAFDAQDELEQDYSYFRDTAAHARAWAIGLQEARRRLGPGANAHIWVVERFIVFMRLGAEQADDADSIAEVLRSMDDPLADAWLAGLSPEEVSCLADIPPDEIMDLVRADPTDALPSFLALVQSASARAGELRPHLEAARAESRALEERIQLAELRVEEPLAMIADAAKAAHLDGLIGLLVRLDLEKRRHDLWTLRPQATNRPPPRQPRNPTFDLVYMLFCQRSEIWYLELFQILSATGAIAGDRVAPWTIPLLQELLRRPGRLNRVPVPAPAEKARTRLYRRLSPFLTHGSSSAELEATAGALSANAPAESLWLVAMHAVLGVRFDSTTQRLVDEDQWKAAERMIRETVVPNLDRILRFFVDCAALPAPEPAAPVVEEAWEPPAAPEPAAPVAPPPPAPGWWYVREPGNPASAPAPIAGPEDPDRAEALARFMRHEGLEVLVPAASLAAALAYYASMPPEVRMLLPHEARGEISWRKLKRGRARILVREDGDRLLVHFYARRDWHYAGPD